MGDGARVLAQEAMRSDWVLVCVEGRANSYKKSGVARWPPGLLRALTLRVSQESAIVHQQNHSEWVVCERGR